MSRALRLLVRNTSRRTSRACVVLRELALCYHISLRDQDPPKDPKVVSGASWSEALLTNYNTTRHLLKTSDSRLEKASSSSSEEHTKEKARRFRPPRCRSHVRSFLLGVISVSCSAILGA